MKCGSRWTCSLHMRHSSCWAVASQGNHSKNDLRSYRFTQLISWVGRGVLVSLIVSAASKFCTNCATSVVFWKSCLILCANLIVSCCSLPFFSLSVMLGFGWKWRDCWSNNLLWMNGSQLGSTLFFKHPALTEQLPRNSGAGNIWPIVWLFS